MIIDEERDVILLDHGWQFWCELVEPKCGPAMFEFFHVHHDIHDHHTHDGLQADLIERMWAHDWKSIVICYNFICV
jgi:hypothetical protein